MAVAEMIQHQKLILPEFAGSVHIFAASIPIVVGTPPPSGLGVLLPNRPLRKQLPVHPRTLAQPPSLVVSLLLLYEGYSTSGQPDGVNDGFNDGF